MKLSEISKHSFLQLCVIYAVAVLLAFIGLFSRFAVHFEIAALVIALLGIPIIMKSEEKEIPKKIKWTLLILSIILIIGIRSIYYYHYDIPLGYDAGLYKYGIESGLQNLDKWILGGGMEPGFLYLMTPLNAIFGSSFLLTAGFIFCTLLLGLAVYFCSREYFGEKAAIISLLFYAVSTTQYLVFTYLYYKNVIALAIMLFALAILPKKETKYRVFFVILGAIVGMIHRPTFFIFGISYLFYTILSPIKLVEKRYDFKQLGRKVLQGVAILAIALVPYIGKFWPAIQSMFLPVLGSLVVPGESPGTFISLFQYQFTSLPYLVLALLGIFACIKLRKLNYLAVWFLVNTIIVVFQLFFFNRFIIHLDIVLILFAGFGASQIINHKKKLGIIIVALLILSSAIFTVHEAVNTRSVINQGNFEAIQEIPSLTDNESYVMAVSKEYSPWLLAYSERKTIAPGLFDYDSWTEQQWNQFWISNSTEETKELMKAYPYQSIYLFRGTKNFSNPCFQPVTEELSNYVC